MAHGDDHQCDLVAVAAVNHRLADRVSRLFWRAQVALASAAIGAEAFYALVEGSFKPAASHLITWLVVATVLTIVYVAFRAVPRLQAFVYYRLWLRLLRLIQARRSPAARILSRLYHLPYEQWILDSSKAAGSSSDVLFLPGKNQPSFVQRDHLTGQWRRHWQNWAYAIVMLFSPVKISRDEEGNSTLTVDLSGEAYGIFNGKGKTFVSHKLGELGLGDGSARTRAERVHPFLMAKGQPAAEVTAGGPAEPLRWASGGALAVVRWRNDEWFVLNFRGINPIGLNLAAGASESAQEWTHLYEVSIRELCEELIVLDRSPLEFGEVAARVYHKRFLADPVTQSRLELRDELTSSRFVAEHHRLRSNQDGLQIFPSQASPQLSLVETPFSVQVIDGDPRPLIRNLVLSVNALEAGIECATVLRFRLADNDYLLFGEVLENGAWLAREPIVLLRRSYVESVFASDGTIGEFVDRECKQLSRVPAGDFHIFDADIELRRRRLHLLLTTLGIAEPDPASLATSAGASRILAEIARRLDDDASARRTRLRLYEARFLASWLSKYAGEFASATTPGADLTKEAAPHIVRLCPITWKTLELVCQHQILH